MPYLSLGAVLVLASVVAFAVTAAGLGDRTAVLAVAQAVPAGEVIDAADLQQVSVAADGDLRLIPAGEASQVVGRTAAVPLAPGMLLTSSLIGEVAFPPPGKVAASVALKPGQFPQGLTAGASVAVYVTHPNSAGTASSSGTAPAGTAAPPAAPLTGTVLGVEAAPDGQGGVVVTLLLAEESGPVLAAAPPGGLVLMQTAPGGE